MHSLQLYKGPPLSICSQSISISSTRSWPHNQHLSLAIPCLMAEKLSTHHVHSSYNSSQRICSPKNCRRSYRLRCQREALGRFETWLHLFESESPYVSIECYTISTSIGVGRKRAAAVEDSFELPGPTYLQPLTGVLLLALLEELLIFRYTIHTVNPAPSTIEK